METLLVCLLAGYGVWLAAYLLWERRQSKHTAATTDVALPKRGNDMPDIVGKSSFRMKPTTPKPIIPTPQTVTPSETESAAEKAPTFAPEAERQSPARLTDEELDAAFEHLEIPDVPLEYPADCDYADMIRQSTRAACIDCGIGAGTVRAENPVSTENGTRFILSIPDFCREEVELPVHGRHMVTNALLAAAAGWVAGLAKEQIASGLTQARLTGGRLHCSRINGILVVDDTYNANPDSMQAALRTLAELSCAGRRFAVLGRMGELGVFSEEGHVLVGRTAEELRLDCVVSVGTDAARITDAISPNSFTQRLNFSSAEEAAEWLRSHTAPGDIVLFKGSRLARMEQVMNLTFPPQ